LEEIMNCQSILGAVVVSGLTLAGSLGQAAPAAIIHPGPTHARYSFPSVGLVPGQTLRVTVASQRASNPPDPDRVRILLVDDKGRIVADSGALLLPAVQSQSFDVPREAVERSGEEGTGRIQLRAIVTLSNERTLPIDPCRPGLEVIATATGQTAFVLPPQTPRRF
jgi:hypothetical protein